MQRLATQALTWGMDAAGVSQGVTIVMNPQTGEILAMVSLPAYDNNKFAGGHQRRRVRRSTWPIRIGRCATTRSATSTRPARPTSS